LTAFFDNREIASTLGKFAFTAEGNMSGAKITPAFQDYDHTSALVDGAVTVEGYDLKTTTISPPSQIFLRMFNKEEFDASEMSLSNYMIALEHGDRRFVAISVFPSRVFRHSYIWINTTSNESAHFGGCNAVFV